MRLDPITQSGLLRDSHGQHTDSCLIQALHLTLTLESLFYELSDGALQTQWLHRDSASLLGVYRAVVPPDPIPNSVVKRNIADGSVGSPHVRVGQRQALILKALSYN